MGRTQIYQLMERSTTSLTRRTDTEIQDQSDSRDRISIEGDGMVLGRKLLLFAFRRRQAYFLLDYACVQVQGETCKEQGEHFVRGFGSACSDELDDSTRV